MRQNSSGAAGAPFSPGHRASVRQDSENSHGKRPKKSFLRDIVRRKQVSLDLYGPNDFFVVPSPEEEDALRQQQELATAGGLAELEEASTNKEATQTEVDAVSKADKEGVFEVMTLPKEKDDTGPAKAEESPVEAKLFSPLRFKQRVMLKNASGKTDPCVVPGAGLDIRMADVHIARTVLRLKQSNNDLHHHLMALKQNIESNTCQLDSSIRDDLLKSHKELIKAQEQMKEDKDILGTVFEESVALIEKQEEEKSTKGLQYALDNTKEEDLGGGAFGEGDTTDGDFDGTIIRASRSDYIRAGVCFILMMALTVVVAAWPTHLDEESFIHSPVGLACVTKCDGDLNTRDFFHGYSKFEQDDVISLVMHFDALHIPHQSSSSHDNGGDKTDHEGHNKSEATTTNADDGDNVTVHSTEDFRFLEEATDGGQVIYAIVEIVGTTSGKVKATRKMGPVDHEKRITVEESLKAAFENVGEPHIINVRSSVDGTELSFTLAARVLSPLANYSELIAALIMIMVYVLILIEVIHRTLVSIIGSMIALLFFFIMERGHTESIQQIMLHLEWSTLGLLFGMMLIVGELSHTGVFEWCSVRLLMASKGSFVRLMVLLCTLTAVASAFLDNVTTMLLVAPVTIDMCNILDVDPRPYLIGEVLLSNIGGTATLIGKLFITPFT